MFHNDNILKCNVLAQIPGRFTRKTLRTHGSWLLRFFTSWSRWRAVLSMSFPAPCRRMRGKRWDLKCDMFLPLHVAVCVAVCVLQRVAACCGKKCWRIQVCVAGGCLACCSVLQRVAACCSVLQRVAACCSVLQRFTAFCGKKCWRIQVCVAGGCLGD